MKNPTIKATVNPAPIGIRMKNGDATRLVTMPAAGLAAVNAPSNASFSSVTSPSACNVSASSPPPSLSKNGCWIDAAALLVEDEGEDDEEEGCKSVRLNASGAARNASLTPTRARRRRSASDCIIIVYFASFLQEDHTQHTKTGRRKKRRARTLFSPTSLSLSFLVLIQGNLVAIPFIRDFATDVVTNTSPPRPNSRASMSLNGI